MLRRLLALALLCLPVVARAAGFADLPYDHKPVTATVRDYRVADDLSNVSNKAQLPNLTDEQRRILLQNGFVARPTREEQLFYLYEHNAYQKIPQFVTTDAVLHTYHVFYDFTLRWLETDKLLPALDKLTDTMLAASLRTLASARDDATKQAARRVVAYFAVPARLLGHAADLPPEVVEAVETDLAQIKAHRQTATNGLGVKVDFTQFIPRGHYTKSEALQRYFQAMMWYGLVPFDLAEDGPVAEALIVSDLLAADPAAKGLWEQVYEPTAFFVGVSDDVDPASFQKVSGKVYGAGEARRFTDKDKLAAFLTAAAKDLPAPRIVNERLEDGKEKSQGRQFKFMGQRFLPDSRVFQELTYPKVGTQAAPRHFPLGLDAMAALGSQRAVRLLDKVYNQTKYDNYATQSTKMAAELAKMSTSDWAQSLYFGWFWTLQPLLQPAPAGYPTFMRNNAWQDKSLVTALGSWTELRHDTVLYGKQSVAEAGGDEPPPPAGYVEPAVEVYERLGWLLALSRQGLMARGLAEKDADVVNGLDAFRELCGTLATISRKELAGRPLSVDELSTIKWIGGDLEGMMLTAARLVPGAEIPNWWSIQSKSDRHMALVTDVHTSFDQVLQEAVGAPAEIWVVAPFKDRLVAFRGATFQYYEFTHPSADRLTDEKWLEQVEQGTTPPRPEWTRSYLVDPGLDKPVVTEKPSAE